MRLTDLLLVTVPPVGLPVRPGTDTSLVPSARAAEALARNTVAHGEAIADRLSIFHAYIGVFVAAFLVTLLATPVMRRLAIVNGVVDRPTEARKAHRLPVAYLGGVAVYLGVLAGCFFSFVAPPDLLPFHPTQYLTERGVPMPVPISVLLGATVIVLIGLLDDVVKISPRLKIAGQLFAAAALAVEDVGVKVAAGAVLPVMKSLGLPVTTDASGVEGLVYVLGIGGVGVEIDVIYWTGTAIIALFVIGACNASNLIDGLDGLLSGVTAISAGGLLFLALSLAMIDDGPRDASRIVLCLSLLGACMGFLPHNFNPATIFLGDCGSMLLGYTTIVIILTLGDTGKTQLVLAGLIIYGVPLIDTTLAIVRRKVAGKSVSDADDQHLHHMLKRALGVKGAVLSLYGIAAAFAVLGAALSLERGRVTYVLVMVLASFIGVTAYKIARQRQLEEQTLTFEAMRQARTRSGGDAPGDGATVHPLGRPGTTTPTGT